MIPVSSSGTQKVRFIPRLDSFATHSVLEYLRGKSSPDECADLFKDYKSCLTVGR
jgi:hypothetical protein